MKDNKFEILYSDHVNDIISKPPRKIVRWGTVVIFSVFTLFVLLAWIIKYPDVISAPVVISKSGLPAGSVSQITGDKVPENSCGYIGRISLGIERSGKVAVDQKVNIKVSAYPFFEYGILEGTIRSKTFAESSNTYDLEVTLNQGLKTTYGITIEFTQNMQGSADILTNDKRFLQRIINPLRHQITKNIK
ncbi:MAG: hypothetical protein MUF36_00255 [Bacteroidales bacterium]|jgi:hypothetical protein|nr:hypothetical protein [Bacteroidales bacterium]